jgi:hypothetical protein
VKRAYLRVDFFEQRRSLMTAWAEYAAGRAPGSSRELQIPVVNQAA